MRRIKNSVIYWGIVESPYMPVVRPSNESCIIVVLTRYVCELFRCELDAHCLHKFELDNERLHLIKCKDRDHDVSMVPSIYRFFIRMSGRKVIE